uniref:Uncharacterized protein n=1 Tax=Lepeophtheirus salmonis TaxID=72036 RepID=A0A0K2U664_LEPSM
MIGMFMLWNVNRDNMIWNNHTLLDFVDFILTTSSPLFPLFPKNIKTKESFPIIVIDRGSNRVDRVRTRGLTRMSFE